MFVFKRLNFGGGLLLTFLTLTAVSILSIAVSSALNSQVGHEASLMMSADSSHTSHHESTPLASDTDSLVSDLMALLHSAHKGAKCDMMKDGQMQCEMMGSPDNNKDNSSSHASHHSSSPKNTDNSGNSMMMTGSPQTHKQCFAKLIEIAENSPKKHAEIRKHLKEATRLIEELWKEQAGIS